MGFILLCKQLMERKQRECDVHSTLSSQREWFDTKWLHWFPFRQLLVNLKLILPPIVVHLLWIAYMAYFVRRIQLFKCGVHCFKHLEYAGSIAFRASPTAPWVRLDHHCLFLQRRKVGLTWVDCHAAEWGGEGTWAQDPKCQDLSWNLWCLSCPSPPAVAQVAEWGKESKPIPLLSLSWRHWQCM